MSSLTTHTAWEKRQRQKHAQHHKSCSKLGIKNWSIRPVKKKSLIKAAEGDTVWAPREPRASQELARALLSPGDPRGSRGKSCDVPSPEPWLATHCNPTGFIPISLSNAFQSYLPFHFHHPFRFSAAPKIKNHSQGTALGSPAARRARCLGRTARESQEPRKALKSLQDLTKRREDAVIAFKELIAMLGTALPPAPNHSRVLNGCYCLQPHSSRR